MRVILTLNEQVLKKLGEKAGIQKRSRKNYMELILENEASDITEKVAENNKPENAERMGLVRLKGENGLDFKLREAEYLEEIKTKI